MAQVQRSPEVFDVVVVGSGAGGGTTVRVLTEHGIKCALLEAGPMLNVAKEFKEHQMPYDVPHRGAEDGGAAYFGKRLRQQLGPWRGHIQILSAALLMLTGAVHLLRI